MLGFWQILIGVFVQLLFAFPLGHLLLGLIKDEKFDSLSFFVRLPVYIAIGMAGYVVLLSFVGCLFINSYLVFFLAGIFWLFFLYTQKPWTILHNVTLTEVQRELSDPAKREMLISFLLLVFSFLHFISIASGMGGWAPPGDSVWHGMRVSIIKQYQSLLPSNISSPLNEAISPYYPKGFYVLSVAASFLTNTYPGEAILIFATAIASLIPSLLFTIVYVKTKSKFFSFVAFLMAYIAPGGSPYPMRGYSVFASYLQGVYPSLSGTLLTIAFFCIVVCFDDFPHRSVFQSAKHILLVLLLVLAIGLTYYSFLPLVVLYFLVRMLLPLRSKLRRPFLFEASILVSVLVLIIFLVSLPMISLSFANIRTSLMKLMWLDERWLSSYFVPATFLFSNENGVIVVLSFLVAIFFAAFRKHQSLTLLYLCFAVPLLLSMHYELYTNFLLFFTPFRALIAFIALSYVMLAIFLSSVWERYRRRFTGISASWRMRRLTFRSRLFVYVLAVVLFTPLIYASFTLSLSSSGRPVGDDYDALVWIDQHASSEDVILNDRSSIGVFLLSFSPKNVVFLPEVDWPKDFVNRLLDCFPIYDNPDNSTYLMQMVKKYNIRYILVSSLDFYYDFWHGPYAEGKAYAPSPMTRKYTASEILLFFDNNNGLRKVFGKGNVGVYETILL